MDAAQKMSRLNHNKVSDFIDDECGEEQDSSSESDSSTQSQEKSDYNSSGESQPSSDESTLELQSRKRKRATQPSHDLLKLHNEYNTRNLRSSADENDESAEVIPRKASKGRAKSKKAKVGAVETSAIRIKRLDENGEENDERIGVRKNRKTSKKLYPSTSGKHKNSEEIDQPSILDKPTKIKDLKREIGSNAYSHKLTLPKNTSTFTLTLNRQGCEKLKTNYLFNVKKEVDTTDEGVQIVLLK